MSGPTNRPGRRAVILANPSGGRPLLGGVEIGDGELLEIRSGGRWARVRLGVSRDRYKRWVLRFERNPDVTVLAIGTPARRVGNS